jgi:NodT family efflux transporter outer membrane factor (OMF) lipoprotein
MSKLCSQACPVWKRVPSPKGKRTAFRRRCLAWLCLATIALSSCKVGPKYRVPAAPVSTTFKEPPPPDWKEAQPQDNELKGNWWELFADAQLNELVEQVNTSNFDIAAAEARFRSARAAITVARADLFPVVTVSGSGSVSRFPSRTITRPNVTSGTFFQLPIDLAYEVDAWGRIRNSVAANIAAAEASSADIGTIRLSTQAELAMDYFELRGTDEQRRLLEASVNSYEEALLLTTNRFNQGVVSQVDVAQAQTQLDTARAQLIDVGVTRAQLEHAIAILIGKPPAALTIPLSPIGRVEPPAVPVVVPSELLERRPDIASAERLVASANALIGVAKAAYFPTIGLSGSVGLENSRIGRLLSFPNLFWSLGATAAQIVFDAGRRTALTAEAQAGFEADVAAYRQIVLISFQDVEDNLAALRILSEEAQQQSIAIQSSQLLLDLAMNRYRGGITTYLEVITAQNALLANQRAAASLQTDRMTATVLLIKALGGGWDCNQLAH